MSFDLQYAAHRPLLLQCYHLHSHLTFARHLRRICLNNWTLGANRDINVPSSHCSIAESSLMVLCGTEDLRPSLVLTVVGFAAADDDIDDPDADS